MQILPLTSTQEGQVFSGGGEGMFVMGKDKVVDRKLNLTSSVLVLKTGRISFQNSFRDIK